MNHVARPVARLLGDKFYDVTDPADEVHRACGGVAVEPIEGGWRVTTIAGSVCGDTLENACAGAIRRYEEEGY